MLIGFQTANYFARAANYETSMDEWGNAERQVIENFSLAEFDRICLDIKNAGFEHIELWMGHAFPKFMTPYLAEELKEIWQKHCLSVYSYSCSLGDPVRYPRWTRLCFDTAKMLGIDMITSGISKEAGPVIYGLCNEYGLKVAVENHPEKHPDEIRTVIGDYGDLIGAAVDTGWFGTQGYSAPHALQDLKEFLFHVHLKDVKATGQHHPVALGEGIVGIGDCIKVLKEMNYDRTLSIEYEAGDHDPTHDCAVALQWIKSAFETGTYTTRK
ncbi:sugar phosphate isomerase/epimerase family protein [Fictibacillus terranigra]|uniref:Sugar phosphate isomerase/epimerase family protein n=1 Tax=Fictibacillus terranigra TaxID=3058424 RepID=A0ABT8EBL8_9BACL|nr:sugar phosphate isomerase/epimerase family protein [Fictibacillus sp. CENA-BCM004]MDN4075323.1 sugar phosphate isomerase/epimerase family protein [Fictibacillus sp. CENA-BCM004]